jgi:hypothetical protein
MFYLCELNVWDSDADRAVTSSVPACYEPDGDCLSGILHIYLSAVPNFFELLVYLFMLWLCWCRTVSWTSSLLGLLCLLPGARLLAFGFHIHLLRRPWVVSQACIPIIAEYLPGATLSIHARTLSVALFLVVAEPAARRLLLLFPLVKWLKNLLMRVAIGHIHWTTRKSQNHMMAYKMWYAMLGFNR